MKSSFKISFIPGLLLSVLAVLQPGAFWAQDHAKTTVFQIGEFNRSSVEFAGGQPNRKVNFVVSQNDPAKDWFGWQPATLRSAKKPEFSIAAAPREITFSLDRAPAKSYRLHIALLIESPSVPALRVAINGKTGTFYLQPILDYHNGDQTDSFDAAYSRADVVFDFPGSYLHTGANTITLQAVEQMPPSLSNATLPPDAALTYDAIKLDRSSKHVAANDSSAQILPTIFYRQWHGQLEESVDVVLRYAKPVKPGSSVDLTLAGKHYRQAVSSDQNFGEEKLEFSVPEFPAHTQAQLTWNVSGRTQHAKQFIDPQKKWTLFLVPHIHLDVGSSDYQGKVAAIQSRVIDEAMHLTAQHPDFRFSLDGYWPLEQFMKMRTPAEQQRLITAIQKQQLFLPAQYANLLTGFPTAETLIRSLYPSANFSRKYGTPLDYANISDVPSYSWSYASILAAAGIPYLAAGSDSYRGPVLLEGRLNENSPMWWVGPDGKKILLWYSRHYMQMQFLFGLPPLLSSGHDTLPLFLQMYQHPSYRANATILFGTQVENTDLFPQQAELAQKWNSVYAYPHIEYSGFHDALRNIAQQFGNDIPTISGDGGPYWEDGIASDAYYAAMERRNESRGPSTEKLATLTALINPKFTADKVDLNRMWTDMVLFDEHSWGSYDSVSDPTGMEAVQQLEMKDRYAMKAQELGRFVMRNSMASIANSISVGRGNLIVFNTLNWTRSALVSYDLDDGKEIVDPATGQVVPVEILSSGYDFHHVRFVAQDVPTVGYKVYQLRDTKKTLEPAATIQTTTLESPYYRVQLDAATDAVRSIYDKQLQRELVSQDSPYRFGEYLYVTGGDKSPNNILHYSHVYPKPALEVHPAHNGRIVSVERTPYGWVARLDSTDTNTPKITTEIQLFDHQKKIEFTEDVTKKDVYTKEGVYFAFPFSMDHPQFQYEIQNGVVDPAKDMYPGAGHEWFSLQHWVSAQQNGVSATVMPLDASLVTLGDINRGEWPETFGKRPGTIFSYVMNNYWDTNYRAGQGGHFSFHYVITSAASTEASNLSRMGWEEITPLETDEVTSQDKPNEAAQPAASPEDANSTPSLDRKQGSLLEVEDPNVLLETWKPAEDGDGTILRFLDLGGSERTVAVQTTTLHLAGAWQTDAVERGQTALSMVGDNQFHFTIHPHEIVTVRIVEDRK